MKRPPRLAQWLLAMSVPPGDRDAMLGDLAEEVAERGSAWYWRQCARSLGTNLGRRFRGPRSPDATGIRRQVNHGDGFVSTLWQDLRYAVRTLLRAPAFLVVLLLTLGLGVGVNTAIFSVVDGIVLHPFPFPEAERLVGVGTEYPRLNSELGFMENLSPAEYLDIASQTRTLEHVVAWDMGNRQVSRPGTDAENVFSGFWWGDAFPVLGIRPELGRGFLSEEITRNEAVAVIGYPVWQSLFAGDTSAIGKPVLVNGNPYTLIGVMPRRASLYGMNLWIPMPVGPDAFPRARRQFQVIARIKPGVTMAAVNQELEVLARRTETAHAGELEEYRGWRMVAWEWTDINVRDVKMAGLVLLGAVSFVLLLVCANLANLLLGRATSRRRELAVRTALGAGRGRLLRQLLTESLLLSVTGGLVGAALAALSIRGIAVLLAQADLPLPGAVELNLRVLTYALGVSILSGLIFGLLPAWQGARPDVQGMLRAEGGAIVSSAGRLRLQRTLVGVEVALAVVLLAGSGLLVRSFWKLQAVEPGFNPRRVLTFRVTLPRERYSGAQFGRFFTDLVDQASRLPGVTGAAAATQFPGIAFSQSQLRVQGQETVSDDALPAAYATIASPGLFRTLEIPLRQGRLFAPQDRVGSPVVAVVNEIAARRFFGGETQAVGKRFRLNGAGKEWFEVIGVVGAVSNRGLDTPPAAEVYASLDQFPDAWNQLFVLVRASEDPTRLLPSVRAIVKTMDPQQPLYMVRTIEQSQEQNAAPRRLPAILISVFAGFALILAAVGVYGVVSYSVSQRTAEIGVRLALGADRSQVSGMVVRQALWPVGIGAAVGLALAIVLGHLMSRLLFQVSGHDPLALGAVIVALGLAACVASYLPARRASRMNPVSALGA